MSEFQCAEPPGQHTHTMTREFHEDMKTLQDAADALGTATGNLIREIVRIAKEKAKTVQDEVRNLRNTLQEFSEEVPPPDDETVGLWAAGLGQYPLSARNNLRAVLAARSAATAGTAVRKFCDHLRTKGPCGGDPLLLSLVDAALAEDDEHITTHAGPALSPEVRTRLEHLHSKMKQRVPWAGIVPPPYLWPSTYVSSSSSGSYSSSSWPPEPSSSTSGFAAGDGEAPEEQP